MVHAEKINNQSGKNYQVRSFFNSLLDNSYPPPICQVTRLLHFYGKELVSNLSWVATGVCSGTKELMSHTTLHLREINV